jgi:hypothetical protein
VATGGSGSGPNLPQLPSGWDWNTVLLVSLGVLLAIPAINALRRKYFEKPEEPEHSAAKVEEAAVETKQHTKGAVGKAASAVKHATIDPIRDTVAAGVQAVKHSETTRTVQHKAEDLKDSADVAAHDASSKAERAAAKAKKEVHHAADHSKSKADDTLSAADSKVHEAKIKAGRAVQRGKEKLSDTVYEAEAETGKAAKGMLEGLKGAATSVGRRLHLVADSTEKGTKKTADKAERALGVKTVATPTTSVSERKAAYYTAGGVAVGAGVLGALYYWDRKGGDLMGKISKLRKGTKEAADSAVGRAKEVLHHRTGEPAGPKTTHAPEIPPTRS